MTQDQRPELAALPDLERDYGTFMTPAEVSELFRVDPTTVVRWANQGLLSTLRTPGGHRRYRTEEIRAIANGRGLPGAGGKVAQETGEPLRSLWRRPAGSSSWEHRCDGARDVLSRSARRWRGVPDPDGVTADYLVLPPGEIPDDDSVIEAEIARDIRNICGGWA